MTDDELLAFDKQHIWHPYSSMTKPLPMFAVASADGTRLRLRDGRELIDGMASWWSVIHGYNHPALNDAITAQLKDMSHVMFGGLTHEPAVRLCKQLLDLTPKALDKVFISDSGSVAVEVAIKMAVQYWHAKEQAHKHKLVCLGNAYHGDTFGAMAACDPTNGMHHLFSDVLAEHYFVASPACGFTDICEPQHTAEIEALLANKHDEIAAVILEPIVQGAGGMKFYSPEYLKRVRELCDEHNVLLIADEIATGFGRTGKMFACEWADVVPDILCVGKALTGGYMSLAATLCSVDVAETISSGEAGVFMHGPTFMANPLACAVASASLALLQAGPWQANIQRLEAELTAGLADANDLANVADVRVLGAIAVIELKEPVDMSEVQPAFVERGVWLRPFGKLIYVMPPYIMSSEDVKIITSAMVEVVAALQ